MMIETDKVGAVDAQVHQSLHAQSIVSRVMCMPTRLEFTNQSMGGTAKTVRYDLDSLTGKYVFFTCYLLANGGQLPQHLCNRQTKTRVSTQDQSVKP